MSEITNSHQHFPSNLYLHEVDYETKKFNEIINIISKYSRYQYILVTFIALYSILISYCAMIGSFVFMNPVF